MSPATLNQRQKMILDLLKNGPRSVSAISHSFPEQKPKTTIRRDVHKLIDAGLVERIGTGPDTVYQAVSQSPNSRAEQPAPSTQTVTAEDFRKPEKKKRFSWFSKKETGIDNRVTLTKDDPPLINLKVTNPVTYFKRWWRRMLGGEGVYLKFSFRIKPFTAVLIIFAFLTIKLGVDTIRSFVGRTPLKNTPIYQYLPEPSPTPNPWREAGFSGTVQYSELEEKFFLITDEGREAIKLTLPDNIDLAPFVYSKIFALGLYNEFTNTLHVTDASNLELLPYETYPIPTTEPTPSPSPTLAPLSSDTFRETTSSAAVDE